MAGQRVIIVGGGIIGTACAYYLAKRGCTVTIIEQGKHGRLCSHANCGLVSPSHILPLAVPGAIRKSIKLMRQRNSPVYVKPSLNPRLWKWLYSFARRCRHDAMLEAGRARHTLLASSRPLYDQLIEDESIHAEYETQGCLFVYQTEKALDGFVEEDELLRREFGVGAVRLDGSQLIEKEPALRPGLAGAWYYEIDAHLRPDRLLAEWRRVLENMGVSIQEDCSLKTFRRQRSRALAIETSSGEMDADVFIVATGALTPMLNRHLGCRIPIQPGKGYSITMPRPAPCPTYPMLCPEHKLAVTPLQSAYRLGSTMEFSGYDDTLNRKRLDALKESASHYLLTPTAEPVEEEWYGWRPMTYDGKPIIDRCPTMNNVWIAAGHNMLGLSMAPATGLLVSEMVLGQSPHVDPAAYRINRF